jgi:hypothetical protein
MLQRKDSWAFIERIVDAAIAPPSTAMFAFPRRSPAASLDISGAGVTPESMLTAL